MKDKKPRKITKNPIFPLCSKAIAVREVMDQILASTLRFPQGNVKKNVNFREYGKKRMKLANRV